MDPPPLYLDYAATTPLDPEARRAMDRVHTEAFANPSSIHPPGLLARRRLEEAREELAALTGCEPEEVIWTSGGTESSNLAIRGLAEGASRRRRHVLVSAIEHPSVLGPARALAERGFAVETMPPAADGTLDPAAVAARVRPEATLLVAVMHVNNEIGSVLPVGAIARAVKARSPRTLLHVDAVQSFTKLPVDRQALGADTVSLAAHKVYGPKGVGALLARKGLPLRPLLAGGGQERGLRPGTENVAGAVGFVTAARRALEERAALLGILGEVRESLLAGLRHVAPDLVVHGPRTGAAPHVLGVSFPGLAGEAILHHLEARGIFVSTGSACSTHGSKHAGSHVLRALGLPPEVAGGSIRYSFGRGVEVATVPRIVEATREAVEAVRRAAHA